MSLRITCGRSAPASLIAACHASPNMARWPWRMMRIVLSDSWKPTTNTRGRLCGTNDLASSTTVSIQYPNSAKVVTARAKSAPPLLVRKPVTFSSMMTLGFSLPSSLTALMKPKYVEDASPSKPFQCPARERSVHGNEAVAKNGRSSRRLITTATYATATVARQDAAIVVWYLHAASIVAVGSGKSFAIGFVSMLPTTTSK